MGNSAHNRIEESGNRYGKLYVLGYGYRDGKKAMWKCRCDCGTITYVSSSDLRRKDSRAIRMCQPCGEQAGRIHGHTGNNGYQSPTYTSWRSMLLRCSRDTNYIDAGITVCDEWKAFNNFLRDMGERPTINHTLDRIDGALGYEAGNCRWATKQEQARNLKSNVWVEINGETKILTDWLHQLKLPIGTYYDRRARGLSPEEALTTQKYCEKSETHKAALRASAKRALSSEEKEQIQYAFHNENATFKQLSISYGVSESTIARACGRSY